jgi:hypothetical protein
VGLLYRPESQEDYFDLDWIPLTLLVAKNRNGPTGEIHFKFFRSFTRFEPDMGAEGPRTPESTPSAVEMLCDAWQKVLNAELVAHSTITGLTKGTLFVRVDDQKWLRSAIEAKSAILTKLKEYLGKYAYLLERISFNASTGS